MISLHKYIRPECLPEDYEGKLPKIDYSAKEWYPVLRSLDDMIEGSYRKIRNPTNCFR